MSSLQLNPGFPTMGFAEVNPRQLAPTVGTRQVGITISVAPPSANRKSRTRARSNPLEELRFIASLSIAPPRALDRRLRQNQSFGDYQSRTQRKKIRRHNRRTKTTASSPVVEPEQE